MFRGGLTPLSLGAWRIAGGTLVLLVIAFAVHRGRAWVARVDAGRFLIAAWMGVALNQWLYLEGVSRSTPTNAGLMMCLIPVFTIALATAVGIESFSMVRMTGVLIALAGTLFLLFDHGLTNLGRYGTGNLLMVANSLLYSGYLIVAKPLLKKYPPLVMIAWAYAFSLPLLPLFVWHQPLVPTAPAAWWGIAFSIAFPTVLAYILNMYALARVNASTTAIYVYGQPLLAGLASWAVFGERPTPSMLVAAAALFIGIRLVSKR